jgi:predicted RecB family nuclease
LLVAFDALLLSQAFGRAVSLGKIIHGEDHATLKVKTSALVAEVQKRLEKIAALLSDATPPDLVLNRHCAECEFQARCRQKAVEKDDLSLLAGMSAKERQKLRSKGIFTVTQLSYTFRPRRRPKRLRDKREKYYHSLKALAIREKKIHIVGSPEFKIEGTPVYLDVEGLPDRDFYYLIGVRIGNGESAVQHSLWADTVEDEGKIWREFLGLLETIEKPVLIHYGSYETTFLKEMSERYGVHPDGSPVATTALRRFNLLSVLYSHIYFPTYSNGLKDVTGWLGFKWSCMAPSGTQAIAWRQDWEYSAEAKKQQQLIAYNSEDCAACEFVVRVVWRCCNTGSSEDGSAPEIISADSIGSVQSMWPKFSSQVEGFEAINKAGRWDYQRHRIYVRTEKRLKRVASSQRSGLRGAGRINEEINCERPRICPQCGRTTTKPAYAGTKTLYDLRFTTFGVRRWAVRYHFRCSYCASCHVCFGKPKEFWHGMKYGRNIVALLVFKTIDLCMPQRAVTQDLNRLFQLEPIS